MQQPLSATPDELLAVVRELYPQELDRAVAELTIRKQDELILSLTKENELLKENVVDKSVESHHGHSHDDGEHTH